MSFLVILLVISLSDLEPAAYSIMFLHLMIDLHVPNSCSHTTLFMEQGKGKLVSFPFHRLLFGL